MEHVEAGPGEGIVLDGRDSPTNPLVRDRTKRDVPSFRIPDALEIATEVHWDVFKSVQEMDDVARPVGGRRPIATALEIATEVHWDVFKSVQEMDARGG